MARDRAAGRSLARTWRRAPVGRWSRSPRVIGVTIGLVTWWLLIAGVLVLTMPAPVASAPKAGLIVAPGQTGRIHQPGMPDWPVPVDRRAYDEYRRGSRESDEAAMDHAFAAFEWIKVSDGQAVRIIDVDGEAVQPHLVTPL
jgi:hypothetical protein